MKCKFAQFLFRAFGITGGALAVLFVIYYYNRRRAVFEQTL